MKGNSAYTEDQLVEQPAIGLFAEPLAIQSGNRSTNAKTQ